MKTKDLEKLNKLTIERYMQLSKLYTTTEIVGLINDWSIDGCNKGYAVFDYDCLGLLEIEKIDELEVFETDSDAIKQAIKDGIKIIPTEELPLNLPNSMYYCGFIDTEENRKNLENYAK